MSDTAGVLRSDVLAAGLPWAQDDYKGRAWSEGDECWTFWATQPRTASEDRRWYRAVIIAPGRVDWYVYSRITEGPQAGRESVEYVANLRDDLAPLAAEVEAIRATDPEGR